MFRAIENLQVKYSNSECIRIMPLGLAGKYIALKTAKKNLNALRRKKYIQEKDFSNKNK